MPRKVVKKKRVGGFSPQAAMAAVETFRKLRPVTNIGNALKKSGILDKWSNSLERTKSGRGFKSFISGASNFLQKLGFGPAEVTEISAFMASNYQPLTDTLIIL